MCTGFESWSDEKYQGGQAIEINLERWPTTNYAQDRATHQ